MIINKSALLKQALWQAAKTFAANFLIGWLICVALLFSAAHSLNLFEVNNIEEFADQLLFSVLSLSLPILVAPVMAFLKFNNVYFPTEE